MELPHRIQRQGNKQQFLERAQLQKSALTGQCKKTCVLQISLDNMLTTTTKHKFLHCNPFCVCQFCVCKFFNSDQSLFAFQRLIILQFRPFYTSVILQFKHFNKQPLFPKYKWPWIFQQILRKVITKTTIREIVQEADVHIAAFSFKQFDVTRKTTVLSENFL